MGIKSVLLLFTAVVAFHVPRGAARMGQNDLLLLCVYKNVPASRRAHEGRFGGRGR